MSNKTFFMVVLPIVIILSFSINHKIYGNSNTTISNVERLQAINHSRIKTKQAKPLAYYMYNRIKFYQEFDTWWERQDAVFYMYKALQKMDIK